MKRASRFFTDFEKSRIEQAVREAEAGTSAEIVPVVATASGRYDRAEDVVGLWLGCILLLSVWLALNSQRAEETHWGSTWSRYELAILVASVVLGFILGAAAATYVGWLRRVFTPRKQMTDEVTGAARSVFFDRRVHHTRGATGLLIYLSLFERMASVVADQAVLDSLGQSALDELCNNLIAGIRAGDPATALCEIIADAGARLNAVLPGAAGDPNEIANPLVVLD